MIIEDSKLYVGFHEQFICIKTDVSSKLIEDLECNQEEANTRMLLHTQHICGSTKNVIIHASEADALIIASSSTKFSGNLCILNATKAMPATQP